TRFSRDWSSDVCSSDLGDFAYEYHTLVPPEHFREDVTIETFQFTPEQPGDPEILAALRGRLPAGTMADPFADCLAGAISVHGTEIGRASCRASVADSVI